MNYLNDQPYSYRGTCIPLHCSSSAETNTLSLQQKTKYEEKASSVKLSRKKGNSFISITPDGIHYFHSLKNGSCGIDSILYDWKTLVYEPGNIKTTTCIEKINLLRQFPCLIINNWDKELGQMYINIIANLLFKKRKQNFRNSYDCISCKIYKI